MGKDRGMRGKRDGNRRGGFGRGSFGRGGFRGGPRGRGVGGNHDGNQSNYNNQWQNRPRRETPGLRLTEEQIGVTKYMSEHEGFNGIIKLRYSDFQVSEINEEGVVAKLTTLSPPEPPAEEEVDEDEELLLTKYNVEILPLDTWDQINKVALGEESEPVEIDMSTSSKEERTRIHDAVKKAFGDSIVGSTVNANDKKVMKFEKFKKGVRIDNRVKWAWPADYVYFVVHKENCDTMDAATRIADCLKMHVKAGWLGYAGSKDRRAKTSQWFSARRVDPRRIASACRGLRDVVVGDYSFHTRPLRLGMLRGNMFHIALRNVTAADSVVAEACARLQERGFINYYGLQRFGTKVEVPTFEVGLRLLKGNFQEAIDCILQECEGPLQPALQLYKTRGAAAALHAVPRRLRMHSEGRLLQSLAENPNDLLAALQRVPRNTRLLYLHAYQSLLWNRCVTERIARAGLRAAAGDLVPPAGASPEEIDGAGDDSEGEETQENPENAGDTTEEAKLAKEPEFSSNEPADKNPKKPEEKKKIPVKVLTQEDVDSGRYTIFDVIMPLPGYNIDYPPNMIDYYEKLLADDGLKLELKQKYKSYSMSGAYRRVAARVGAVSWRCVRYDAPHADLILSDLDNLNGRQLDGIVEEGAYKAAVISFSLSASCYATMALRELLKVDTACDAHAKQNNYHKRPRSPTNEGGKKAKLEPPAWDE